MLLDSSFFLITAAGSLVQMADGRTKPIEEVLIGIGSHLYSAPVSFKFPYPNSIMSLTSPSQNIPYEMRLKQLEGRIMAAAKLANPTAKEFSGMDYQQSTRLTRTLGQMDIVVQPPTNPRYVVSPPCAATAPAAIGDLPDPLSNITVSALYVPGPPYNMFDIAFDISWAPVRPFVNTVSVSMDSLVGEARVPINNFASAVSVNPITNEFTGVSNYTDDSYTNINVNVTVANDYGEVTTVIPGPK